MFFEAINSHNSTNIKILPRSPGSSTKLGNASPKGGLAFFWESFIIIFLKIGQVFKNTVALRILLLLDLI